MESDIIDMQITNSVVCCTSKGCIYKQIKPPLVGEHAFPLTGFVCRSAHVTVCFQTKLGNGGGGGGGGHSSQDPKLWDWTVARMSQM